MPFSKTILFFLAKERAFLRAVAHLNVGCGGGSLTQRRLEQDRNVGAAEQPGSRQNLPLLLDQDAEPFYPCMSGPRRVACRSALVNQKETCHGKAKANQMPEM